MRQNSVLPHHGHQVRSYAHHQKVEQGHQGLERHSVSLRIRLHHLESHAAAGEVIERIVAILPFRVKHRCRRRQGILREVVVADDHIYTLAARILHLVNGLDAAVQGDYQAHTVLKGVVYALEGHSVTFVVAVGNVEIDLVREAAEKGIHQSHGSGAVDIIVAIDEYRLTAADRLVKAFHSHVHVLHQERIVQIVKIGAEEGTGLVECLHAPFYEQIGKHLVDADLRRKPFDLLAVGSFLYAPFTFPFLKHIQTKLSKYFDIW